MRPERIALGLAAMAGIKGKVRTRVFQGAHWLFQVDTRVGGAVVIAPNDGTAMPVEGDDVTLTWKPEDMAVSAGAAP